MFAEGLSRHQSINHRVRPWPAAHPAGVRVRRAQWCRPWHPLPTMGPLSRLQSLLCGTWEAACWGASPPAPQELGSFGRGGRAPHAPHCPICCRELRLMLLPRHRAAGQEMRQPLREDAELLQRKVVPGTNPSVAVPDTIVLLN